MALVADDRCLVAGQTDQTENGIYVVDTGTWSRAPDFDSNRDIAEGTQVRVTDGSNAGVYVLTTSNPITLDTSNIVFANESSLVAGALLAANNFSDLASPIAGWDALARYTGSVAAAAGALDLSAATAPLLLWTAGATSSVTLAQGKVRLARTSAEISVTCSSTLIVNGSTSGVHKIPTDTLVMFIGDAASVVRLFTMSAAWSKGADVASAGTIVLRPNALHHVTGTTTITDVDFLPAADGARAWVIFDGALTLTHNATTLILPGGANIPTAANDRALFYQDSSDNVVCLAYIKADGTPIGLIAATQADQETGTSTSTYVSPGRQQFHPSAAKCWGSATGDGTTLSANYNISGITDTGTGDILFTIGTDFSSTTWTSVFGPGSNAVGGAGSVSARHVRVSSIAAGTIQMLCTDGVPNAKDSYGNYTFAGFGDQ